MKPSWMAGAYWGPRKEPMDQCAERLLCFLKGIEGLSPAFCNWRHVGKRRYTPVEMEAGSLRKLLERGVNRTDIGRKVIEQLGVGAQFWNGRHDDLSAGLMVQCSSWTQVPGLVPNFVTLDMPVAVLQAAGGNQVALRAFRSLIECWEPEHTFLTERGVRDQLDAIRERPNVEQVGWLTYFRGALSLPDLKGVHYENMGDGIVAVAHPRSEGFDVARADYLQRELGPYLRTSDLTIQ